MSFFISYERSRRPSKISLAAGGAAKDKFGGRLSSSDFQIIEQIVAWIYLDILFFYVTSVSNDPFDMLYRHYICRTQCMSCGSLYSKMKNRCCVCTNLPFAIGCWIFNLKVTSPLSPHNVDNIVDCRLHCYKIVWLHGYKALWATWL